MGHCQRHATLFWRKNGMQKRFLESSIVVLLCLQNYSHNFLTQKDTQLILHGKNITMFNPTKNNGRRCPCLTLNQMVQTARDQFLYTVNSYPNTLGTMCMCACGSKLSTWVGRSSNSCSHNMHHPQLPFRVPIYLAIPCKYCSTRQCGSQPSNPCKLDNFSCLIHGRPFRKLLHMCMLVDCDSKRMRTKNCCICV